MQARGNLSLIVLGKDILTALKKMLTHREGISLKLTSRAMYVLVEDYAQLIHLFFPDLSRQLKEKKQSQQPLTLPSFLEEKHQQIDFKKEYKQQYLDDYRDLSAYHCRLFQLFKIGDLAEIEKMPLTMNELQLAHLDNLSEKVVVDCNQQGLLAWASIKGHQSILDYCYTIYENYTNNVRAEYNTQRQCEDLIYAMLCHQASDSVSRLLAAPNAGKNYVIYLSRRSTSTLEIASEHGYVKVVNTLLLQKCYISDHCEIVSMRLAITHGHLPIVQSLAENYSKESKESKEVQHRHDEWPSIAIQHNRLEILEYLFSLSFIKIELNWLLKVAIQYNSIEIMHFLLQKGATFNYQAIKEALQFKNIEVIQLIVATQKQQKKAKDTSDSYNILMVALNEANDDVVHYLIDSKLVDVNEVRSDGLTALFFAVRSRKIHLVKLLISHGANLNAVKTDGTTLLMEATLFKAQEIFDFLFPTSDVNAKTSKDNNLLMHAARGGCLDTVKTLVENGMPIDAVSKDGNTALWQAAKYGKYDIVKFLVAKYADNPVFAEHAINVLQELCFREFLNIRELRNSAYYKIAQHLLSELAVMRAYFSNINFNRLSVYVMEAVHKSMLATLELVYCKYNFLPLEFYFIDNTKTANYAETLFANFLLLKTDQDATRQQLILWIDEFMGLTKFKNLVSRHFMNALEELKRLWRHDIKNGEQKTESVTIISSPPLLVNQEPEKPQPKPQNRFSLFSWCCGNDSALPEVKTTQTFARGSR